MNKKILFILFAVLICMIKFFSDNILFETPDFIIIMLDLILIMACVLGFLLSVKKTNRDIASISNLMLIGGLYLLVYQLISSIIGGFSITDLLSIFLISFPFFCPCVYHNLGYSRTKTSSLLAIVKICFIICSVAYIFSRLYILNVIFELNDENLVSYTNSIYYILAFLPFLGLFKRSWPYYILVFVCIILSGKRTPFIAFSLALFIAYILSLDKKHIIRNTILSVVLLLASLYIYNYIASIYDVELFNRFGSIQEDEGGGRMEIYQLFYEKLKDTSGFEFIFGHGGIGSTVKATSLQVSAHNDFIELFYDFGLVGLLFLIALFVKFVHLLIKTFKQKSQYSTTFAMSLCVFIVTLSFSNFIFIRYFILIAVFWSYIFDEMSYEEKYSSNCAK